jgi:arginase
MTPDRWFLMGAPWDCSGTGRGEQVAPAALRVAGLSALTEADLGDVPVRIDSVQRDEDTGIRALDQTISSAHALADRLTAALNERPEQRPLVVGGDCSILLGIFPALRRRFGHVGLWFLDGHPDYLDGHESDTGETADMDLALLTGDGAEPLVTLAGAPPMIPASDVVLLGHRTQNLDPASASEVEHLPSELRRIDASELAHDAVAAGIKAAEWLSSTARGGWLHVDLDVLDPEVMPAVTYPQPGGVNWTELADVMAPLAGSDRLIGVSVADFRPDLDPTGTLAGHIVDLLARTLP